MQTSPAVGVVLPDGGLSPGCRLNQKGVRRLQLGAGGAAQQHLALARGSGKTQKGATMRAPDRIYQDEARMRSDGGHVDQASGGSSTVHPLGLGVGCRQAQAVVTVPRLHLGGHSCISFGLIGVTNWSGVGYHVFYAAETSENLLSQSQTGNANVGDTINRTGSRRMR